MITENDVNEAAKKVIPADMLQSFLALPIESKLAGLAILAQLGGRSDLSAVTLAAYNSLKA